MEKEQPLTWNEIDKRIVCPNPSECRIEEGVRRYERQVGHTATYFISECIPCGAKGAALGFPGDFPLEGGK